MNCWVDGGCQFEHYRRCVWGGGAWVTMPSWTWRCLPWQWMSPCDRTGSFYYAGLGLRFMFTYPEWRYSHTVYVHTNLDRTPSSFRYTESSLFWAWCSMCDTPSITRINQQILVVISRPHHLRADEIGTVGLSRSPSSCWSSSVTLGHAFTMWKSLLFIIEESSRK